MRIVLEWLEQDPAAADLPPPVAVEQSWSRRGLRTWAELVGAQELATRHAQDLARARPQGLLGTGPWALEQRVGELLRQRGQMVATAESCTGGLLGAHLTALGGSSDYFLGGVVAYANAVKEKVLGVEPVSLERHGAVSAEVAEQMAQGARRLVGATIGIATTGIAGPGGGSPGKPVGLVHIALAYSDEVVRHREVFPGDREQVRAATVDRCLQLLSEHLQRWERHR